MTLFGKASKPTHRVEQGIISPASSLSNSTRPSLLPAFEPVSSSPIAAVSRKRRYDDDSGPQDQDLTYPTPVPTSDTNVLPSSPAPRSRPALQRTASALSERSPLSDVPTLLVPENGQRLYLGRSSNSCDYQLPYNRLISRRHVSVRYEASQHKLALGKIMIECLGWNGCIVRCQGRAEELGKDDIFVVADPMAEIILDVMETRVILGWPEIDHPATSWNTSPSRPPRNLGISFASSPPLRLQSTSSPSPSRQLTRDILGARNPSVEIFEDPSSDDAKENNENTAPATSKTAASTFDGSLSSLSENENEENEPLVHSFGPQGANILSRFNSFTAQSPAQSPEQVRKLASHPQISTTPKKNLPRQMPANISPIKNHVINQLAFSRVHAVPASALFKNLPADLKNQPSSPSATKAEPFDADLLRDILHTIPCVGEIARSGKDAAGKPLENEFYYVPDKDENIMRRDAVAVGMGNSGLRSVRKNHKQYYWKKPRA